MWSILADRELLRHTSLGHWRAGNTDFAFLRDWGPGIAVGVVVAQFTAPTFAAAF
jgi:hypothetical protein